MISSGWRLLLCLWCALPSSRSLFAVEWPEKSWPHSNPTELGLDAAKLEQARDYALTAEGSGYIVYKGKLVMSWGDPAQRYDLKSSSKAIGGTLLGITLKDGKANLDDPARKFHPKFGVPPESNATTGCSTKLRSACWRDEQRWSRDVACVLWRRLILPSSRNSRVALTVYFIRTAFNSISFVRPICTRARMVLALNAALVTLAGTV